MTHRLATNYAKNYCNRTPIVKVIVENVVTCFGGDTVYVCMHLCDLCDKKLLLTDKTIIKIDTTGKYLN